MLASRLIELVETHAGLITRDVLKDLSTNFRTRAFHRVPVSELDALVFAAYHNLAKWIGDLNDDTVRTEYQAWGVTRFRQGVPLAETAYALILVKQHLREFVRNHGILEFSGD